MSHSFDLHSYPHLENREGEKFGFKDKRYKAFTLSNFERISELRKLSKKKIEEMRIVAHVLPFKTNNYVIKHLIDWEKVPNDPIFRLNFPQKDMLLPKHYKMMKKAVKQGDIAIIKAVANNIRLQLNPNPAGQKNYNVPHYHDKSLEGVQHKYRETALLFPRSGQTCHAYCTFCFRWSQFVSLNKEYKFGTKQIDNFVSYLQESPEVTDVLITGGDPMVMKANALEKYIHPILNAEISHLRTIRIGSKSLSYWPYRFIDDYDTDHILAIFSDIIDSGLNISFMAHFNHFRELQTPYLEMAVKNLLKLGVQIRTQSPILNNINASPEIWAKMWQMQVDLGMIPYYMFIPRDTGAQHYFRIPLVEAWEIFRAAYNHVSGICRTVRGPSMSCNPGKICIEGVANIDNKKVITLKFIQGRNPDWVKKPFFAKYDTKACWIDELEPAFSENFFYEKELADYQAPFNEIKDKIKD